MNSLETLSFPAEFCRILLPGPGFAGLVLWSVRDSTTVEDKFLMKGQRRSSERLQGHC